MSYDAKWGVGRWDESYWDVIYGTFGASDAYLTWLRTYRRRKQKPLEALTRLLKHHKESRSHT